MLSRIAILFSPGRFALANRAQICADVSRLLLGLAFVELLTMPITQHLWTWDRFFHGGQDFELGLFVSVSCLCLVLLRAQHCRQGISRLLALGGRLVVLLPFQRKLLRMLLLTAACPAGAAPDPPPDRSAGAFFAPLQI